MTSQHRTGYRLGICLCLGALFLCSTAAVAAEQRGVVRSAGLPIPGATVTASRGERTLSAVTDENGEYAFKDLPAGSWTVRVEMFGFTGVEKTIAAPDGAVASWELALRPPTENRIGPAAGRGAGQNRILLNRTGQTDIYTEVERSIAVGTPQDALYRDANESFLVSGSLSRGLQFEPQAGFGIPQRGPGAPGFGPGGDSMGGAPPNGGVPGFGPGGENPGQGSPGARGGGGPMVGGRPLGGGIIPPGGRMGPPGGGPRGGPRGGPGPEGRGPGGGRPPWMAQRGIAVFGNRSARGRDAIRGMVFASFNDSAFDARPFSLSGQAIEKPDYKNIRFGIGLGGQLRIPKLIDSSNTFFFLNYFGTRSSRGYDALTTVPSLLERSGDFSASLARGPVVIYDPASLLPFPGNQVPISRIDGAARGLLDFIPTPNLPGAVRNYQFVTSIPQDADNFGLRLMHSISSKDRLSFSFQAQQRNSETAQVFGFRDTTDGSGLSTSLSWSRNPTPTFFNSLRVDFSRNRTELVPFFASGSDVAAALGILGTSRDPANYGPPDLSFTNFGSLTDANALLRRDQAVGLNEGITWIRGRHTVKTGFEYRRNQFNTRTDEDGRGSFSFSGLITSSFDARGNPLPGTGFDMADFLLGLPQSSSARYGNSSMYFRAPSFNWHLQDDWRVRANLSLNLGLRYEYSEPLYEKYDRMANLDIAPGFTGVSVATPELAGLYSGEFPRGLIDPDKNNFAPRIGISWKPRSNGPFLVRAGYGIYYNGSVYNSMASRLAQQPPFAFTNSFITSAANPLTLTSGLLGFPTTEINNTFAVDRGYLVGYAQTWNTAVQMDLPHAMILELGYLGTKGTRLDIQRLPNQAPLGSPIDSEQRRPIAYALGFLWESAEGNSIYHAGQVRLARRFRRGISFNALYTWGKSIDNVSTFGGGRAVVAQNDKDLQAERGLSSFDIRHTLSTFFVATSPLGDGPSLIPLQGWKAKLLKEWTVSGGLTANSGSPLTASILGNRADAGGTGVVGSSRAEATGQPVQSDGGFFNLSAFALPPPGNYGNAGRNTIPGPGLFALNLSLGRSFGFGERHQMEFRVEANNVLNSVSYTRLATTVNASNYGLPTAAASMRTLTSRLRLRF